VLNKYEQRWVPGVQSALGEPVLRCVAMNAAGTFALSLTDTMSPIWRQYLFVNGKPYNKVPRTMFLILTPTRVLITQTRQTFTRGYKPELAAPILNLLRGDAEITAAQGPDGTWAFRMRSRASTAELELELLPFMGIANELAVQLRDFSVKPEMATASPGVATEAPSIEAATASAAAATPTTTNATSEMSPSRRRVLKAYGFNTWWPVIGGVLLIVFCLGGGVYSFNQYRSGTPTTATVVSCHGVRDRSCEGTWNIDGMSYTGRMPSNFITGYNVGSTHEIRVTDGRAYSAASVEAWLLRAGFVAVLILGAIAMRAFIRRMLFGRRL
jgi:hypothetical protein